jgi:hypothetical protein
VASKSSFLGWGFESSCLNSLTYKTINFTNLILQFTKTCSEFFLRASFEFISVCYEANSSLQFMFNII